MIVDKNIDNFVTFMPIPFQLHECKHQNNYCTFELKIGKYSFFKDLRPNYDMAKIYIF